MDYVIVNGELYHSDQLYHHGIKGMKWGRRRWQNNDGSLTPAGKRRYISGFEGRRNAAKAANEARKKSIAESRATDSGVGSLHRANQKAYYASKKAYVESIKKDKAHNKQLRAEKKQAKEDKYNSLTPEQQQAERRKKALKVGAAVAGTALAAYGAYKVNQYVKEKNVQIAAKKGHEYAMKSYNAELKAFRTIGLNEGDATYARQVISSHNKTRVTEAVNRASNDNFRQAAKNVINYKKSGQNLRDLNSADFYKNLQEAQAVFEKRKR